jgi:hypothetical protein
LCILRNRMYPNQMLSLSLGLKVWLANIVRFAL